MPYKVFFNEFLQASLHFYGLQLSTREVLKAVFVNVSMDSFIFIAFQLPRIDAMFLQMSLWIPMFS